jgi:hypothetical protein
LFAESAKEEGTLKDTNERFPHKKILTPEVILLQYSCIYISPF